MCRENKVAKEKESSDVSSTGEEKKHFFPLMVMFFSKWNLPESKEIANLIANRVFRSTSKVSSLL